MQPFPPQHGYPAGPYAPPPPARRSALPWILAGIAVACVVLLVLGGFWWWRAHRSGDTGPVPGQLTRQFPTAPSVDWTLTAEQLGGTNLVSPSANAAMYLSGRIVSDGTHAITMVQPASGRERRLLVVDADGERWSPSQSMLGCSTRIVDETVACITGGDGAMTIYFVDLARRTVTEVPGAGSTSDGSGSAQIAFTGDAAFQSLYDRARDRPGVLKAPREGRGGWREYATKTAKSTGADAASIVATDSLVAASSTGTVTVYSASDGRTILATPGIYVNALPNGSIVIPGEESGSATMVTPDGEVERFGRGPIVLPAVAARGLENVVFAKDGLYYAAAGRGWQYRGSERIYAMPLADAERIVIVTADTLTATRTTDGKELWSKQLDYSSSVTDGDRLIVLSQDGTIRAFDLATGDEQWRIAGPGTSSDGAAFQLAAVGGTLIALTSTGMYAYRATGGAARELAEPQ